MNVGISLACFYPEHIENTVSMAKYLGVNTVEIFINTFSELDNGFIKKLSEQCERKNIGVYSIHPFTSAIENYLFFSPYDRRIDDSKKLYSKYCEAAKILGARVINIHGDRGIANHDIDMYIECLKPFDELSDKEGIIFAHENVFYNSINNPDIVLKLREKLGQNIKFTFDIKQSNKGGTDPYVLCNAMGNNVVNFHVNDYDDEHICMLPGQGIVRHKKIFDIFESNGYEGPALIEVYSSNFSSLDEIAVSIDYLKNLK